MNVTPPAPVALLEGTEAVRRVRALHELPFRPRPRSRSRLSGSALKTRTRTSRRTKRFKVPMHPQKRKRALHEPEDTFLDSEELTYFRFMLPMDAKKRQGFTLLEVLIAAAVFAIVLAAASTVFYGALHLRNGATEALEESLPRQQALAIIQRDLANLVVPGGPLSGVFQTTSITNVVGGQSSPDFYTSTGFIDPTSPWGEIQRVSYVLTD